MVDGQGHDAVGVAVTVIIEGCVTFEFIANISAAEVRCISLVLARTGFSFVARAFKNEVGRSSGGASVPCSDISGLQHWGHFHSMSESALVHSCRSGASCLRGDVGTTEVRFPLSS